MQPRPQSAAELHPDDAVTSVLDSSCTAPWSSAGSQLPDRPSTRALPTHHRPLTALRLSGGATAAKIQSRPLSVSDSNPHTLCSGLRQPSPSPRLSHHVPSRASSVPKASQRAHVDLPPRAQSARGRAVLPTRSASPSFSMSRLPARPATSATHLQAGTPERKQLQQPKQLKKLHRFEKGPTIGERSTGLSVDDEIHSFLQLSQMKRAEAKAVQRIESAWNARKLRSSLVKFRRIRGILKRRWALPALLEWSLHGKAGAHFRRRVLHQSMREWLDTVRIEQRLIEIVSKRLNRGFERNFGLTELHKARLIDGESDGTDGAFNAMSAILSAIMIRQVPRRVQHAWMKRWFNTAKRLSQKRERAVELISSTLFKPTVHLEPLFAFWRRYTRYKFGGQNGDALQCDLPPSPEWDEYILAKRKSASNERIAQRFRRSKLALQNDCMAVCCVGRWHNHKVRTSSIGRCSSVSFFAF